MPIIDYNGSKSFEGKCLYEYERNGYDDSDFFMVVWDTEKQEPQTIEFATTRGACGAAFASKADATPEILAAYRTWHDNDYKKKTLRRDIASLCMPGVGKSVRVHVQSGKNKKFDNMEGVVFWFGEATDYEPWTAKYHPMGRKPKKFRIGVKFQDGQKMFIGVEKVDTLNITEQVEALKEQIKVLGSDDFEVNEWSELFSLKQV